MAKEKKNSFEESYARLSESAEAIKKDGISLEDAISHYEAGIKHYENCTRILENAKQKIQLYDKENNILEEL